MGTLASGSIDLKSLKVAGEGASKYITDIGSNGIKVHDTTSANLNYVQITSNGIDIYKTNGADPEEPEQVASFRDNIQIGKDVDGYSRTEITGDGIDFKRKDGSTDTVLAHIGYATGQNAQQSTSTDKFPYYTFGTRASDLANMRGNWSFAEGYNTTASGFCSHTEGSGTIASGINSHAEGGKSYFGSTASTAANNGAHAEGLSTQALGIGSHAEGEDTLANEASSHAEGDSTIARASSTHAEGYYTIAGSFAQHVEGKYNIEDANNVYAHIIGNGTSSSARSNALAIDWDGYIYRNNHTTPMGSTDTITRSVDSMVAGIDTWVNCGSTFTLQPGTYLILIHSYFKSASATTARQCGCRLRQGSSTLRTWFSSAGSSYAHTFSGIYSLEITTATTYQIQTACSRATSTGADIYVTTVQLQ